MHMPSGLVTIETYSDATEAHIAAGLLESAGIPVYLHGVNHVSANWMLGLAVGVKLQVPVACEQDARNMLAARQPIEDPDDGCPRCGSTDTTMASASWKVSMAFTHLFQIPMPFRRRKQICRSCDHSWRPA